MIAGLLLAAVTVPPKTLHETELREAVTKALNKQKINGLGDFLGNISGRIGHGVMQKADASYIDMLGLEYERWGVCSILKTRNGTIVSLGLFNQVYFIEKSLK